MKQGKIIEKMWKRSVLTVENPALIAEWHPTKNGNLLPSQFTGGSQQKVWWMCQNSHEYRASIANRTSGSGCPYCAGKKVIKGKTDLETLLPSVVSEWHPTKNNNLLPSQVTKYSAKKVWWKCKNGHEWKTSIIKRVKGSKCPFCTKDIQKRRRTIQDECPDVAAEWHPTKNGNLLPSQFTCGSGKKIWWQCQKGHEYEAIIYNRTRGTGCPYCSGQLPINGETDLETLFPDVAAEWHPTKNDNLLPSQVTKYSAKKVWWKCKNGHEWESRVYHRTRDESTQCPYCVTMVRIKEKASL